MSGAGDAELTRELEALVAAKEREQLRMKLFLAAGALLFAAACALHRHAVLALALLAAALGLIALGVRHHLRASALRNQAMEKILAEAFRRAGQAPPEAES